MFLTDLQLGGAVYAPNAEVTEAHVIQKPLGLLCNAELFFCQGLARWDPCSKTGISRLVMGEETDLLAPSADLLLSKTALP